MDHRRVGARAVLEEEDAQHHQRSVSRIQSLPPYSLNDLIPDETDDRIREHRMIQSIRLTGGSTVILKPALDRILPLGLAVSLLALRGLRGGLGLSVESGDLRTSAL